MRWAAFFILGYLALGIQSGLIGPLAPRPVGGVVNVVLLIAIFIALHARRESALLGCFVLGLMQDLLTASGVGVYAFSYGLVAMFVISTQEFVYRGHPLTHFTLSLVGGLITAAVLYFHGLRVGAHESVMTLLTGAVYTAVVGVVVLGLLQLIRRGFGFQPDRRRIKV